MVRRTLLTGLAAVLATAALAGCSGSTKPPTEAQPAPASPSIPAPPTDAPTTPAPSASGGAGGGTGGGVALCKLSDLTVLPGDGGAGAGHWGFPLVFRNKGTATCRLVGYPGVAGLDAKGNQLTQARRTPQGYLGGLADPQSKPPAVDIAPGFAASAYVEGTNVWVHDASECPVYQGLLVTPPDETHSVRLTLTANGCDGLQIHPVIPGETGQQQR